MKVIAIIPARYASSRFPGKPLTMIGKKTMIHRVYERCSKCNELEAVYVATDDERIRKEVQNFGGNVIMTSPDHQSGTDRCAEALEKLRLKNHIIINVQGDEPFIHTSKIEQLVSLFEDEATQIATVKTSIQTTEDLLDPGVVKVVTNKQGRALYFSRNPIPFLRQFPDKEDWIHNALYYKHLGIYAFRSEVLETVSKLKPTTLEKTESLEQLRWLENGYEIVVAENPYDSISIDTPEDINRIKEKLNIPLN